MADFPHCVNETSVHKLIFFKKPIANFQFQVFFYYLVIKNTYGLL